MKTIPAVLLAALGATAMFAAEAAPAFNATLTVGKESRFVLLDASGKASPWLKVGDSFAGYVVKAYDPKTPALELEKDGEVTRVVLAAEAVVANGKSSLGNTPATIAEATAMLDTMQFEKMLDRTLAGVKKQQMAMVEKMVGQMAKSADDKEAISAFQQKLVAEMMGALSGAELKGDVAKIYSEVFSKEELEALSNFYASPIGQSFSDKQPEVAEKMQAVMMPRMMAVMPRIQQMAREFAAAQKAKKAAAPTPTP